MIAKAIAPQNTVGAIGINPRTVEDAVSIMGRNRELDASITASRTSLPARRSASICSIRMTAFLAIMPTSARMPRMATKPSGWRETRSAATTPIKPNGTPLEAPQLEHQHGQHQQHHIGNHGEDGGLGLRTLLGDPAELDAVPNGQLGREFGNDPLEL